MTPLSPDFRAVLIRYFNYEISLRDLERWIAERQISLMDDPNGSNAEMVTSFDLYLAEMDDGIRTERELRRELADDLRAVDESEAAAKGEERGPF